MLYPCGHRSRCLGKIPLYKALSQNTCLRHHCPFPRQVQPTRRILVVPRALKRLMHEQAHAIWSRETALGADVDFNGFAVGVSGCDAASERLEASSLGFCSASCMADIPRRPIGCALLHGRREGSCLGRPGPALSPRPNLAFLRIGIRALALWARLALSQRRQSLGAAHRDRSKMTTTWPTAARGSDSPATPGA